MGVGGQGRSHSDGRIWSHEKHFSHIQVTFSIFSYMFLNHFPKSFCLKYENPFPLLQPGVCVFGVGGVVLVHVALADTVAAMCYTATVVNLSLQISIVGRWIP